MTSTPLGLCCTGDQPSTWSPLFGGGRGRASGPKAIALHQRGSPTNFWTRRGYPLPRPPPAADALANPELNLADPELNTDGIRPRNFAGGARNGVSTETSPKEFRLSCCSHMAIIFIVDASTDIPVQGVSMTGPPDGFIPTSESTVPKTSPRVSVAMCTRNGASFVGEQLRSILEGRILPDEIIISDDASTDNTIQIIQEELSSAPSGVEWRLIRNEWPLGVTKNFEQAVQACSGDLIALSDQDDVWVSDRLSSVISVFATHPRLLLLHSDAILVDANRRPLDSLLSQSHLISDAERSEIASGREFNVLIRRRIVTGATVVFRRSLLDTAAPFPTNWVHDEWLGIIAAGLDGADYLPQPLIEYRQHGMNEVGVRKRGRLEKFGMLLAPGGARNRRLLERSEQLVNRLEAAGAQVPDDFLTLARKRRDHDAFRASLTPEHRSRVIPIFRRVWRQDYAMLSRGKKDILLDLIQPLDD